jgi:hypothetical protein
MMWTVFADDSQLEGKHLKRHGLRHLVTMAAVAFSDDGLNHYTTAMTAIRQRYAIPADCELKWSPPRGSWLRTPDGGAARREIRQAMLAAAVDAGARSVTVVYDKADHEPLELAKSRTLAYVYDKVSLHLASTGSHGMIIADEPGGGPAERRAWLAAAHELAENGTAYTRPERIRLPILASPSDHVEHIQLADLVAGATTAAVGGNPHALDLVPALARLADRNRHGQIGGAGLTVWPPRIMDPYFWLLGEDHYRRKGRRLRLGPGGSRMPWRLFQQYPGT